jgi:hypothetical protein
MPVATINHIYCNTFSSLHYRHILQTFYGKVAIRPPMATKLVVLQSCGVVLEVNPCSVLNSLLFNIISPIVRSRLRFIGLIILIYRLTVIITVEFNS